MRSRYGHGRLTKNSRADCGARSRMTSRTCATPIDRMTGVKHRRRRPGHSAEHHRHNCEMMASLRDRGATSEPHAGATGGVPAHHGAEQATVGAGGRSPPTIDYTTARGSRLGCTGEGSSEEPVRKRSTALATDRPSRWPTPRARRRGGRRRRRRRRSGGLPGGVDGEGATARQAQAEASSSGMCSTPSKPMASSTMSPE